MITSIGFVLLIIGFILNPDDDESAYARVLDAVAVAGLFLFTSGVAIFLWRNMP